MVPLFQYKLYFMSVPLLPMEDTGVKKCSQIAISVIPLRLET